MKMTNREQLENHPPRVVAFDDQLWPIVVAILILASFGAGAILTLSPFNDPRPLFNGGTQLGVLAAVTVLLMWAASQLDIRRVRRGLQLAVLLSFILHLLMVVVLQSQHLTLLAEYRPRVEPVSKPLEVVVDPEYQFQRSEPLTNNHGQPIVATAHEPNLTEMFRQESRDREALPLERESSPILDSSPEVPSSIAVQAERQEAMPQLPDQRLSVAKTTPREIQPPEPSVGPLPREEPVLEPTISQPAVIETARRSSAPVLREAESDPQPALPANVESPLSTRSEASLPAPKVPRGSALPGPQTTAKVASRLPKTVLSDELETKDAQLDPLPSPAPTQSARSSTAKLGVPGQMDLPLPVASEPSGEPGVLAPATREAAPSIAGTKTMGVTRKTAPARIPQTPLVSSSDSENREGPQNGDVARTLAPPLVRPSGEASVSREKIATNLPPRASVPAEPVGPSAATPTPIAPPSRRIAQDTQVARINTESTMRRKTKGPLIDGRTREPAEAFARRGSQREERNGAGPKESTERTDGAIELGLDFLARHQATDGHWSLEFISKATGAKPERASFRSDSAATGLALLSFLGAGYDHYGGRHRATVQRALDHLLAHQKSNGDLYQPQDAESNRSAWFYSHGIAAIALCEAYGMTGDESLAGPAQLAIDFIVASQEPKRGAWRYMPGLGSDTSVSGWQLMALRSGELAGLSVPAGAYEKLKHWLDSAQVEGSQFVYNPLAPNTIEQGHGRRPTAAMTAVGLLMRMHTGWNRGDARMIEGAEHLLENLPAEGTATRPARDTYYWYYATQVMFHMRGKYWRLWSERLEPMLLDGQIQSGALAGSWDPVRPVPDRWGPQGGRIYVTTLNLLSLEVVYRHLPIYESVAK